MATNVRALVAKEQADDHEKRDKLETAVLQCVAGASQLKPTAFAQWRDVALVWRC